jgi:hypothetical protein
MIAGRRLTRAELDELMAQLANRPEANDANISGN